ncbi:MAG TPA: crotonase/enoyl-CoA hydratase family protein [Actinomycetes bacterium]|nr:crotonase/enoyl-CoA hydratase family protein [Actinomycetes bacterium]
MSSEDTTIKDVPDLPDTLTTDVRGDVAVLTLRRPAKRNAIDDETVLGLEAFFLAPPPGVRVVVLDGEGEHFCAGLDLSSLSATSLEEGLHHSRMWHRAMSAIEFGRVPVVSVLKGAVIGGGLELASATHLRVAESSAFYALPEGQRGIYLGGGGSVRLPRLIGVWRMVDLMLTGRVYDAAEGHTAGLSHYLVETGQGLPAALELAAKVATIAPMTAYAVLHALPRIADAGPQEGYLMESLMAAVAQSTDEAKGRLQDFLAGRAAKVTATEGDAR